MTDVRGERQRLLTAVESELSAGRPLALATIVATRGSTYRHAGARLLVRDDASWLGNLSGGCLEGEVLEVGQRVMDSGEPELVGYDLTADEEAIWGWGLGCNGAIDVLVEPRETAAEAVRLLRRGAGTGRPHVLATVVASGAEGVPVGTHLLVTEDGDTDGAPATDGARRLVDAARDALSRGTSEMVELGPGDVALQAFLEVIAPPLRLVVCGAGHDARPLVRYGAELGWEVVVVDDRSRFLDHDRFPDASDLVRCEPADAARAAGADDRTCVVVMSHNFLRDVDYLGAFLGTDVAYVGMLGPSRRLERLLGQLAEQEVQATEADRAKLHGPAGLDLGAETPEEIAWAICAEILAVSRGHAGGRLRDRSGPIHDPAGT